MKRILLVASLLLGACHGSMDAEVSAPDRETSAPARYVEARAPRSGALLEAPARVVGLTPGTTRLSMLHRGQVVRFMVAPGDRVEAEAPVAELVVPEVAEAAARRAGLGSQLRVIRGRISELERLKTEGLTRTQPLFELREQAAGLAAELAAIRALLGGYRLGRRDAARLARTGRLLLRTPTAGVVVERADAVGETLDPGGPPVVEVAGLRPARIEASLLEPLPAGASPVFVGVDGVEVPLEAEPIASLRDPSTGRLDAWFRPRQAELLLPDGMGGAVRVAVPEDSVEVPSAALRGRGKHAQVAVLAGEAPRWVDVEVLIDSGTSAVVSGPVRRGDRVASDVRGLTR